MEQSCKRIRKWVLVAVFLASCGKVQENPQVQSEIPPVDIPISSCKYSIALSSTITVLQCYDYIGLGLNYPEAQTPNKASCEKLEGVFSTSACPSENRVYSCSWDLKSGSKIVSRAYKNPYSDLASGKEVCEMAKGDGVAGVFTAD